MREPEFKPQLLSQLKLPLTAHSREAAGTCHSYGKLKLTFWFLASGCLYLSNGGHESAGRSFLCVSLPFKETETTVAFDSLIQLLSIRMRNGVLFWYKNLNTNVYSSVILKQTKKKQSCTH